MPYKKIIITLGLSLLGAGCATTGTSSQPINTTNKVSNGVEFEKGESAVSGPGDAYILVFVNGKNPSSISLNHKVAKSIPLLSYNFEHVLIDTSTAAKWEKSAHDAFDRDIVRLFGDYVGLPGFALIADADSKRAVGCIYDLHSTEEIVSILEDFGARIKAVAYQSNASYSGDELTAKLHKVQFTQKTTTCPPPYNVAPI